MDKVSIIIPVYNSEKNIHGADYLRQAIDSALAQTYKNIEVVVVNDGSKDNGKTEETALSYGDKIKYIKKENGGVSTALNTGIKNAEGEWISWLSHDDLYTPDKIEVQMNDVRKMQEKTVNYKRILYYCDGGFINSEGVKIEKKSKTLNEGYYSGNDRLFYLFKRYYIGGCGLLIPKQMFEEVGYFAEDMRYMQDMFEWEKAFLAGYAFYVNNKVMSITRIHNMQTSTTGKSYALHDRDRVGRYLAENIKDITNSKGQSILKQYMYMCAKNNSLEIADIIYSNMKKENKLSPADKFGMLFLKRYGILRKCMVSVYYKIRFGTKR